LRVIKNGALLATPFVTVTVDADGERGLLGVAFDPNFASNSFVYVYYTATTPPCSGTKGCAPKDAWVPPAGALHLPQWGSNPSSMRTRAASC